MSVVVPSPRDADARVVHLSAGGASLILDMYRDGWPAVVYWGRAIENADEDLTEYVEKTPSPHIDNLIDEPVRASILPEQYTGWFGAPGLVGSHADGTAWVTRFQIVRREHAKRSISLVAEDHDSKLSVKYDIEMQESGVAIVSVAVTNIGAEPYRLTRLMPGLAVPARATELLDFAGRWSMERVPQRRSFTVGQHLREGRRGRTGADSPLMLIAGEQGFDFDHGDVWGVHCGWSGNTAYSAERTSEGFRSLSAGELILEGEQILSPGETYVTPASYFGWGNGLDDLASRFHAHIRARQSHPATVRPVTLNVWEAVYFDHDFAKLSTLAETAANIGIERFVLDDGWFGSRRDSTQGLGDWRVSEEVWPQGLGPLAARVHSLGMKFGLWFEPEMINLDSDTARAHPEWIMHAGSELPPESRHQHVLDLAIIEAFEHVLEAMTAVIRDNGVDYIKWDQNRDLIEAGHQNGRAGVHGQTRATYRLMAELRHRFPELEIESCSSGGARVDLGVMEHTQRVWASDCIDPLERLAIQRWTYQLLPPELIGSHIGARVAHTTGRTHSLAFRASTVLFTHAGLELDLTELSDTELRELAGWIEVLKEYRELVSSGRLIRRTVNETSMWLTGSVSPTLAVYAIAATARSADAPGGRIQLPGLDPDRRYRVRRVGPAIPFRGGSVEWMQGEGLVATGTMLGAIGVTVPQLDPESALIIEAVEIVA